MALPRTLSLKDGRRAEVRRAAPNDAEAWIANGNLVAAEGLYLMSERFSRTLEEVRRQFADAAADRELWLVAESSGKVIGGANFVRGRAAKNAHVAELGMAVLPEYRGLGLGAALLEEGVEWARQLGIARLKLGVFASNERAIALYRKLGFVVEGRLAGEVILEGRPVDEILMALTLR